MKDMIIHPVQRTVVGDNVYLSAKIDFESIHRTQGVNSWYKQWSVPDTLWFRIPKEYRNQITTTSNSFLTALLGVAMHLNENIHVHGTVSPQLLYNLKEYQRLAHFWCPDFFTPISISADMIKTASVTSSQVNVMCSISGGFDSLYTIWSHLKRNINNSSYQITHTLYLEGFDVSHTKQETHNAKKNCFKVLVEAEGLKFISAATNLRQFLCFREQNNQESLIETAPLFATVLFFEGVTSRFYFSSEETSKSHKILNAPYFFIPLISTENLTSTVYGETVMKYEKMHALKVWPEARACVVTCHANPDKLKNCGSCAKCIRITVLLAIEGLLKDYPTFPEALDRRKIRAMRYSSNDLFSLISMRQLWRRAYSKKKWSIFFDISWVIIFSMLKNKAAAFSHLARSMYGCINPILILYRLSEKIKKISPQYTQLVHQVKNKIYDSTPCT